VHYIRNLVIAEQKDSFYRCFSSTAKNPTAEMAEHHHQPLDPRF
jgi:hypothetical protein